MKFQRNFIALVACRLSLVARLGLLGVTCVTGEKIAHRLTRTNTDFLWELRWLRDNKDGFNGRYDTLVSVEYIVGAPFNRTIIREEDKMKGQREICLYGQSNKMNSMVCGRSVF